MTSASNPSLPPVVAIFGPTGVGKTAASVDLALRFNGEIVNADSRYMYRDLQTGVAKPTLEERKGVRHHLLDLFSPDHMITIAEIKGLAYAAFDQIHAHGHLPILVGGTPLYMNAITEGWAMPEVAPDWAFRTAMEEQTAEKGVDWLEGEVRSIDPVAAERSAGNARRLIRALEVHRTLGRPISDVETRIPPPYRFIPIGITQPRDLLYARLDLRLEQQIADGWIDEVRGLLEAGLDGTEPAFTSIGYRQLAEHLRGDLTLDEATELIRHANHRYVRHQTTWLRRRADLTWFDSTESGWIEQMAKHVQCELDRISTSEP